MPTPVTTARQCLTPEAAQALDEAVAVARRRVHAQTTSLHAVSALLSLPSSALREACSRARSSAYSARIQFKALELCLGVSLDRLPSSPRRSEEPPISNSLMAAIKRSQANQRRQPESFHLYQQQQQSSSVSMVKVELQNLVLSILDDPVVSRVFGEAGFRSCDIKLAILRPVHQLLRYSRYRGPPMFLCNLTDENFRRIGEVLKRPKGRNPLLIGGCANDALHSFCETLERRKEGYCLPVDIYGLNVIRMGADVSKFVGENSNEGLVKVRFKEVALMVEHFIGPGVIISYGDVKELVRDQATITVVSCVIEELTRLQDSYGGKVWLIGAVETYETYWKFLNRFPMVEKDWDLRLLPITSLKPALEESYPKSSLMESFVPFGGFFSTSDLRSPFGGLNQCSSRCHLCNEKYEQEVYAIVKRGFTAPDVEQSQYSLPSWLEMTELSSNRPLEVVKTRDEGMALSAKVKCLQRKWGNICQRLHHASQSNRENLYEVSSQVPPIIGHKVTDVTEEDVNNCISNETNRSFNAGGCGTAAPCMSTNFQKKSSSEPNIPLSGISKDLDTNVLLKKMGKTSEFHDLDLNGLGSPPMSNSSVGDGHTSPPSTTSMPSDLGLRIHSSPINKELKASTNLPFSCSLSDCNFDQMDAKMLYRVLTERISWQEEAVSAISQAIIRCRTRNEKRFGTSLRGDIWFNFLGPDNFSKKKIAVALVEILYGNRGNFIRVDLNSQDGISTNGKYDERELNGYDVRFRGKNVVDHIAWELSRKPLSVVFLENIVKADVLVQNSLSQALRTGKFPDSHGREVGINNTVFVTTSSLLNGGEIHSSAEESSNYPEESLLRGQKWPVQMVINCHFGKSVNSNNMIVSKTSTSISYPCVLNKTKLTGDSEITEVDETLEMAKRAHRASSIHLDLNLPAEDLGLCNSDVGFDSMSKKSKGWLEEFFDLVDETVVFKPFDFVKIAEEITKEIAKCFDGIVGLDCLLEIDSRVMDQILASVYLSDKNEVEDWVKQVLSKGFVEARARYNLASPCIVKLITRESHFSEERAPGVFLPARIIVE